MELVKNIFFNTDKLIENSTVRISYTGKFFQDGCEKVYAHFGFGNEWNNINEIEMEKTELGFQEGQNYVFPLEKVSTELVVLEDEPTSIGSARKLRKSYLWSKKIKLAVYKIITYLPKILSGNYKRKTSNENN